MEETRKRRSAAQWSSLVEQWSRSGESAERFAARQGVKPGTLRWWQTQLRKRRAGEAPMVRSRDEVAESASTFARVQVVDAPRRPGCFVEIVTREGALVRVHGDVDESALRAALRAVSRC